MGRERHCTYCWNKGHNRRTCSELTNWYKETSLSAQPESFQSKHYAEAYTKRTGLDLDGNFVGKPKQERRASVRQCSWCRGRYHNKRTCPKRAEWMEGKMRGEREIPLRHPRASKGSQDWCRFAPKHPTLFLDNRRQRGVALRRPPDSRTH